MKEIAVEAISSEVARLCLEANFDLNEDVLGSFHDALHHEESPIGRISLHYILRNAEIAKKEKVPMCQDTGFAVVFVELGQEVHITGGNFCDAINEGVRRGYEEGYLRKSIVSHPFNRKNTGDNTPAVIHVKIVPGDSLRIIVAPKGGGSENMSAIAMLKPTQGIEGVKSFVLETVKKAGPNPCPPIHVGVGVGGTFERAAYLAKKALLRPVGVWSPLSDIAALEKDLLKGVNDLGIGPQGLGGRTTAFWVSMEIFPCHIASLPVAVNLNCHAARHKEVVL